MVAIRPLTKCNCFEDMLPLLDGYLIPFLRKHHDGLMLYHMRFSCKTPGVSGADQRLNTCFMHMYTFFPVVSSNAGTCTHLFWALKSDCAVAVFMQWEQQHSTQMLHKVPFDVISNALFLCSVCSKMLLNFCCLTFKLRISMHKFLSYPVWAS